MMRWRVAELAGQYQMQTGQSLTYRDISQDTGIAGSTLSRLGNGHTKRVDFNTLNTLLAYFSGKLGQPLETGDLLKWEPDRPAQQS